MRCEALSQPLARDTSTEYDRRGTGRLDAHHRDGLRPAARITSKAIANMPAEFRQRRGAGHNTHLTRGSATTRLFGGPSSFAFAKSRETRVEWRALRASYNGNTLASQARAVGSIPIARSRYLPLSAVIHPAAPRKYLPLPQFLPIPPQEAFSPSPHSTMDSLAQAASRRGIAIAVV